jgi:type I restriction enzyme R subunit
MPNNLNEDSLAEQPAIDWLKELGYEYEYGPDISAEGIKQEREDFRDVVLVKRLRRSLERLNPELAEQQIEDALQKLVRFDHPDLVLANKDMYKMISAGVTVDVRDENGDTRGKTVRVLDFEDFNNNEFLVVNQFAIQGPERVRRPDLIVFVNGLPLAIFELKNPASTNRESTPKGAFKQLRKIYMKDIPDIFKYNQVLVAGDLIEAKHGTITAPWEWFLSWKRIDDIEDKPEGLPALEVLVRGMFNKERFLDIIQNFVVYEAEKDSYAKKMCLYHQYYGVNKAIEETLRATSPKGDKKIGVYWHTQGSGKSLSMVFYVNKTRQIDSLKNPTFVFLTDRNDLDGQLHQTFSRSGYPQAIQADGVQNLKDELSSIKAGGLIFSTIQKFETDESGSYPLLSERDNIVVLVDEAHRSQYAKLAGNVRQGLKNASFMGVTGTPVSLHDRDTQIVFGTYISPYTITEAKEDGATVPIYYECRLVPIEVGDIYVDEKFEGITENEDLMVKASLKKRWATLERAVGSDQRIKKTSKDIIEHFNKRSENLEGKAMVVTISRRVAVEMYKLISSSQDAPEVAVVISKPEDFKEDIQAELDKKELEKRFKDPDDPLKMIIVCDMWLTGFDVPPLHTMYIDKPLRNHTLMQAIARVNRIYKDKPGGLIVDYIGIAENLKKSLAIYSRGTQNEAMIPLEEAIAHMEEKYDIVKSYFSGIDYKEWYKMQGAELARLFQEGVNAVITNPSTGGLDEERKRSFLNEATILSKLFALIMPHPEANKIRNEVAFFQGIKKAIVRRTVIDTEPDDDVDTAVRELISQSISAAGVVDIFDMQKKDKPDISIFDEQFIEEVKKLEQKNVAIQVLRKLLNDEIKMRMRKNLIRYRSLLEMLEDIIEQYENNIINSTKVIEKMIEFAKEIKKADKAGEDLGLSEEELAFYDSLASGKGKISKNKELKDLVKKIVKTIRKDLTVDWTNNDVIKSRIKANVSVVLLQNNYTPKEAQLELNLIFDQARARYRDYVPVRVNGNQHEQER